jgi:DinB superfamily
MEDNGLPAVGQLEATPEILRGLMRELTEEDARWKSAPDRFSVAEVLAHLSHSEGHCYRLRLDRFMNEERPELEPDDAQFHLDLHRSADPEDSFDHFEEQRESNIKFLRNLPEGAGARRAIHKEAGEIRWPRCCTNGPCTISGISARLQSWCARANTWPAPANWESPTN